jgi:hypothetical protein
MSCLETPSLRKPRLDTRGTVASCERPLDANLSAGTDVANLN